MFHNAKIVSDEEIGKAEFFLKVVQQIENLGLNRDVKGRDGFVADYEFGRVLQNGFPIFSMYE